MIVYTKSDKIVILMLVIGILLNAYCFFDDLSTANVINLIAMMSALLVFIWYFVRILKYKKLRIGSLLVIKFPSIYLLDKFLTSSDIENFEIHGNYLLVKVDSEDTLNVIIENSDDLNITYVKNE